MDNVLQEDFWIYLQNWLIKLEITPRKISLKQTEICLQWNAGNT